MGCCCSKKKRDDDDDNPHRRTNPGPHERRRTNPETGSPGDRPPQPYTTLHRQQRRRSDDDPSKPKRCPVCQQTIDGALYAGHRETCRLNRTQQAAAPPVVTAKKPILTDHSDEDNEDISNLDIDELCAVCMDARKICAFVPCGHLSVCVICSGQLSTCPICRGPKDRVLRISKSARKQCMCKFCKHVIGPTFFDSHQEVCRLRQRQLRQKILEEQEATESSARLHDSSQTPLNRENSALPEEVERCVECKKQNRSTALLPCGHFLYCEGCAKDMRTCTFCCTPVAHRLQMFE